jgi:hypothetical protein
MPLQSALEDLLGTTLAGVEGLVGKIEYVASLRDVGSGNYSHWGLSRAHGDQAAQQALAEAHRLLFLRLLQTPLRTLRDEILLSSGTLQMTAVDYVEKFLTRKPVLLPKDLGGGSALHFSSVLDALSLLVSHPPENPRGANPPA